MAFNIVLVVAFRTLVRVRNLYGLQYSIPNDTMCVS